MTTRTKHPNAGQSATITVSGEEYRLEDWAENVFGQSWMHMTGNISCINYAIRSAKAGLPINDEVVYGKIGAFGHLMHVSELTLGEQQ